jgi:hypothetical protein
MSTSATRLQNAKSGGGLRIKAAIVILGLAALAGAPLVMVLIPGMMPTLVTLFIERHRARYLSYTVGVMNFAGVLPILLMVATGRFTMAAAGLALANPMTWIIMYGAAAAGWLICGMTPPLARLCLDLQANQKRRALEAMGKAIREEWGEDVAGTQKPADRPSGRARQPAVDPTAEAAEDKPE